jgi:hypothetical protein
MATILGLALKVTGDASGLAKSLDPVDRALASIGKQVERATAVFAPFTAASAAAANAQQGFADRFAALAEQFANTKDAVAYADAFARLTAEAKDAAAAFAEGLRITERNRTEEDKRAEAIARLNQLLDLGAIGQREYNAEIMEATGVNAQIAAAERERADNTARAAAIIEANLSATERAQNTYNAEVAEYQRLRAAGVLGEADFNKAVERSADAFAKVAVEAGKAGNAIDGAGKGGKLQFNELSGVLSALPGPLGSVAGRISGLASAGEGLGRIFSGGLSAGLSGIGASVAALVNPFTVAAVGIAGFGAAAAAVASGLGELSGKVEQLGFAARQAGVDFETIQILDEAATRAGVSVDALATGIQKFGARLTDAAQGSGETFKALEQLGFTLEDIQSGQKDPTAFAGRVATALEGIPEPARQAALQIDILGRGGESLVRAFGEIPGSTLAIRRFGGAINELDKNRLLELDGAFENVQRSILGLGRELLTPFIGITQSISEGLAPAIATFSRNIGALLDIFSPITSLAGGVINVLLQLGATFGNIIGTALEPFAAYGRIVSGVIDNISSAYTVLFTRINDAILGFREFFKFEGVAAAFRDTFAQIGEVLGRVSAIVSRFAEVAGEAIGRVGALIGKSASDFLEFTGVGAVITSFAESIGSAFGSLWQTIKDIVGQIGGFIESVLKFAEDWLGIVPEIETPIVATVSIDDGGAIAELLAENKEFKSTLDGITKGVSDAINESTKFGKAGFDAAVKYQSAVDDLKKKLDAGLFNEETFKREAERAGAAFKEELARVEEGAQLEIQIKADAEKTLAGVNAEINKAAANATQFGQAGFDASVRFQEKLRDLGKQFGDGRINAATLAAEVEKSTAEYEKQIAGIKQIDELQKTLLKNDQDRVAALIAQGDTTTQAEKDIETVTREQLRLEEEIRKQRAAGNVLAADAAAARLAQLDQIQAKLADEQQAIDQGFGEGFAKSFEATNKSIDELINKAAEFGNAGAAAAQQLEAGVAAAQRMVEGGVLGKDAYEAEVARQRQIFEDRLAGAKRVEEFLLTQIDERQRMELNAAKELEDRKILAAKNVEAIETKITETKLLLEKAREEGDLKAAKRRVDELNQLKGARQQEQAIADGKADNARQQFAQQAQQQQQLADQQQKAQEQAAQEQARQAEENRKAAEAEYNRQQDRLRQLNTLGSATVNTSDVRTAEGAALVLDLAASAQDPELIEARIQTKLLNQIALGLAGAASNYFNQPVAIVGAARLGGFG